MKPLLLVFAYSGMDAMIERHYAGWESSGCDILLCFPVDAPCARGGLAFDTSCHYGAPLMRRTFRAFWHALRLGYDTYYFIEADSVVLGPAPRKLPDGMHCFLWENHDPRFKATRYPHWPLAMNRKTLVQLESASWRYDPGDEMGFPDRLIGRICEESGIPMIHRPDLCHSRNRISDDPWHEKLAREAIRDGITFLHGIKTEQDLRNLGL